MPEYAKLKNAELEALLKERGLPHAGKKADMVDRLTKDDEKKAAAGPESSKVHPEDEIDWDDEPVEATKDAVAAPAEQAVTEAAAPAVVAKSDTVAKAGGTGQPPNPQAVPNQKVDIDPSKTDDLSVKAPAEQKESAAEAKPEEPKEHAPDYTQGIAATDLDSELQKRKARAQRFGLKTEDDESLKKLERAKKFGESGPPKGLDEALPERQQRKRGREDTDDGGRNKRRGGGRSGGGNRGRDGRDGREGRGGNRDGERRRDNRDDNRGGRDTRRDDRSSNGNWMSVADRERAEARKAKWAKPAAAS